MTLQLRYAAHSEIGLVRKNNQDSGYASPRLLVIADGMGGAAAGDLASAAAVQQLRRADRGDEGIGGEEMLELLAGALLQANDKIADLVADDHSLEGMGTTVTAALFDGKQLGLVHIGDSRAYVQRGDELIRLTHDHSWVQSLVDEGKITAEEAAYHPHRSLLLKVLNGQPQIDPDAALVDLEAGDRLLFCSDGLCGLVEDDELSAALTDHTDLDDVLDVLIDAAHREGGVDNITIIVADVHELPGATASDAEADADSDPTEPTEPTGAALAAAAGPAQSARLIGAATEREVPVVEPRTLDLGASRRQDADASEDSDIDLEDPVEADEETIRYAPTLRTGRRRLWRGLLIVVLIGALLGAGLGAGYAWSRTQYFVGPSGDNVAIHRGLAQTVLGVPLSDVYEVQDIRMTDLPPFYRDRVNRTISLHTLDEARNTTLELREAADRCIRQRAERENPPPPAPTPDPNAPVDPNAPADPNNPAPAPDPNNPAPPPDPNAPAPDPNAPTEQPVPPTPTAAATATPDPSEVC
ncbi:protein phosphatase 2C domain-containing protein [Ammonicoccus fulvus]|uniref:Protein phosphatase 2C domain-containing protein n=1 Tax=Ammonicoccus fulvus TaxID=3138240 RepID=A0ABZ3FJU7_9ACTN